MDFGTVAGVKLTFSHKYLLLGLGVLVAIIIAMTAWNDTDEKTESKSNTPSNEGKMNLFSLKIRKNF